MNKYENINIFTLMKGWREGENPARVLISGDTINHFNEELVGKWVSKEYSFGFATDTDATLKTFSKYRKLLERKPSDNLKDPVSYRADVTTLNITRNRQSDLDAIKKAYESGEMNEETYQHFLHGIMETEYPEHEQFNTGWSLGVLLSENIYTFENAHYLSEPLSYRNINDHTNSWAVKEAHIGLNGFFIRTNLFQDLLSTNTNENITEFNSSKVTVTMPYVWREVDGREKGAGDIRIEFLLDKETIQVFFDKHGSGGYPVMTGIYSVETSKILPQELRKDEWSAVFMRPNTLDGAGKPLDFEFVEDFLDELITLSSEYTAFFLKLAFELLLVKP